MGNIGNSPSQNSFHRDNIGVSDLHGDNSGVVSFNRDNLGVSVLLLSPVSHHHTHIEKHHTKQMSETPQFKADFKARNLKRQGNFFEVQPTPGGDPEHMQRCEQPVTIKRMINSQVLDQRVLLLSPVSHHHTHIEKHHTKQMSVTPQFP